MNFGLLRRTWREVLPATAVLGGLLFGVSTLLAYALPQIQARFLSQGFVPPQIRQIRDALLGIDTSSGSVADVAFAVTYTHPVVLMLMGAHAILVCTRVPAAEIDRGTIDVLLALPVSRLRLFVHETLAWLACSLFIMGAMYFGSLVGTRFIPPGWRPDWGRLAVVLANLFLVYTAVGVTALLASALSDRRSRAVLFAVVFTVGSLLMNFLEPLWEPAKHVAFLSILHYYRPINMLMRSETPARDMTVLVGASVVTWIAACVIFCRRDITTT